MLDNTASGEDDPVPSHKLRGYPVAQPTLTSANTPVVSNLRRPLLTNESSLTNPWRNAPSLTQPRRTTSLLSAPAAPIAPMRERDTTALLDFFDREDILEVERDINYHLLLLFPEPYWEEDDWEFLQDHL
jgi:hypothetical protein